MYISKKTISIKLKIIKLKIPGVSVVIIIISHQKKSSFRGFFPIMQYQMKKQAKGVLFYF